MNAVHPKNRGQVLIIFVLAIIGLVGIVALAIDGGNILYDRRHAQNAADTAALAAAITRVRAEDAVNGTNEADCINVVGTGTCGSAVRAAAQDMAKRNGYDWGDFAHVTFEIHTPPINGYYQTCANGDCVPTDYVQVIIRTTVQTWFARVVGIGSMNNRVEAVALAKYRPSTPLYGGDALVILAPDFVNGSSGEFGTKGGADIVVDGGDIFVNSKGPTAFKEASCMDFDVTPLTDPVSHFVKVVGGHDIPLGCSLADQPPPIMQMTLADQLEFPPEEPISPEPIECHQDPVSMPDWPDGYAHLTPGYYSTAGSNKFPPDRNSRLDPGVYCIDGLLKTNNPTTDLQGNGVLLYIRKGGSFSFGGGSASITAPPAGSPYAGWLIYAAPDYSLSGGSIPTCNINAGAGDTFTGVIYAPYCNTTINGGSDSVGLRAKLIVYTLLINGTNKLTFYYDSSMDPGVPERLSTSLLH